MSGHRLTLRAPLQARADLSGLTPAALAGLDGDAVSRLTLPYGNGRAPLGDLFMVASEGVARLVIEGDRRLDHVGAGLTEGEIHVEGPVGAYAGRSMSGGLLKVDGDAGDAAACGMTGGRIAISGSAGARLASAPSGARRGMSGGLVEVKGAAGPLAGERLRGGLVLISGDAGEGAASNLIAGTMAVGGHLGPDAGRGMKRGTLILAQKPEGLAAGFVHGGEPDLVALLYMSRKHKEIAAFFGGGVSGHALRYVGDLFAGGEGEVLVLI